MEPEKTFSETVRTAERILDRMIVLPERVLRHLECGEPRGAFEDAMQFAGRAEKLVLLARQLPVCIGPPDAPEQVERVTEHTCAITVGYTEKGWFQAILPALLPSGRQGNGEYLRSCLALALKSYFQAHEIRRYTDCVLIFRHVYDKTRSARRMRDHDNIETKRVADLLALYLMPDDNPTVCSHYDCSVFGNEDRTEVFVVPGTAFPEWLKCEGKEKNGV